MKINTETLEDRQVQLTVEIPGERLQAAMHSTARRLSRETRIPGFRPGKAPYNIIINKFGEQVVFEETLDNLGKEIYHQALEETELDPYGPGSLDEVVSRDPLVIRYTVPLPPEVNLGNYREIRIPYEDPQVTDDTLEAVLEDLRQRQALIEPADRPAQLSDVVVLDIRGELREPPDEDDSILLDKKGVGVLVAEETDWPVPGIAEHLIGLEVGDDRHFEYIFPEDYPSEDLHNLTADFHLTCLEVKSRIVPNWSDDLARNVGDYNDLLDLRLKIRGELLERAQRQADAEYAQQVIEATIEDATVSYPPILLQDEVNEMLTELERRLMGQNLNLEDYLKIEKKTKEELRSELEPRAIERLTQALVLGKLVEVEELEVGEEEVSTEIDRIIAPFKDQSEEIRKSFDNPMSRRHLTLDLLTNKAIKKIVAIAKGELNSAEETSAEETSAEETSEVPKQESVPDEGNPNKE